MSCVQDAHRFLCVGGLADCGCASCRDFETVSKDNERAVSEMKALADSFEKEVRPCHLSQSTDFGDASLPLPGVWFVIG